MVIGGHLDSFDAATGAIDNGNGTSSAMEAIRLLAVAGVKPVRSVMVVFWAAEEMGLWGAIDAVGKHPEWNDKISLAMGRDSSPHAVTGASVPPSWYEDFERFTAPLKTLDSKFPFTLSKNIFPVVRPENYGSTDITVYSRAGIPTLISAGRNPLNDFNYQHVWHTLYDTYDAVVPYAEHQQQAAICQAVIAYGVAALPNQLSRDDFYLGDGLYADIVFGTMEAPKRVLVRLDTDGAPEQVAHFLAAVEGRGEPQRRFGAAPPVADRPSLATVSLSRPRLTEARFREVLDISANLPRIANRSLRSENGLLGFSPQGFAISARPNATLPSRYTPVGSIVAITEDFGTLKSSDPLASLRIYRVGDSAKAFRAAGDTGERPANTRNRNR